MSTYPITHDDCSPMTNPTRFMPGSCSRSPTRTNLQVEDEAAASYPTRLAEDLAEEVNIISAEGQGKEVSITESGRAKQILLPAPTSKLGALDHFVEEDPGSHSRHHPCEGALGIYTSTKGGRGNWKSYSDMPCFGYAVAFIS